MVCLHYEDIKLVYSDALGLLHTGSLANHPFWPLICRKEQPADHPPPGQNCSTIIHPEALRDVYLSLRITSESSRAIHDYNGGYSGSHKVSAARRAGNIMVLGKA